MIADCLSASRRRERLQRTCAVAALLVVLALQLLHVARCCSANWDEAHHLYDGYTVWTKHDYRLNPEVPPLVKLAAALPLLPMRLYAPPNQGRSEPKEAFLDGRAFVFGNGGDRVLLPARMVCMVFPLVLGWLIYAAARRMFGTAAGLIAFGLFVFDPNVLANGSLVETDVASACCFFGTVYAFYLYGERPSAKRLLVTGGAAGLTLAAKFTGVLIVPMLLLPAVAEAARARSFAALGKQLAACGAVFVCAWAVLWGFYGFRFAPGGFPLPLGPYIQSIPNGAGVRELLFAARHHLLPAPYLWGLANTKKTEWEYVSYFFGRVYRHGPWQYFPAAFLIKSTLPLLLLLLAFPFVWIGTRNRRGRELAYLLLPMCVYFAVVCVSDFDIGARHLLPVYPFLYVPAAAGAAAVLRRGPAWAFAVVFLLGWQVVTSVRVCPAYMAYGNEAWGGPSQVHRYLSDANVDWGQQLKFVKQYLDANHITNCWFAYFPDGAVEPSDYGVHCKRLPTGSSLWWFELPMQVPPVIDGTVLISDSDLEGIESGDGPLNWFAPFRAARPVAVIQHGVYVYRGRFAVPLMAALVEVRRSAELAKQGQTETALALAAQAVALAPNSAIAQLNLADLAAAQHRWSQAGAHYRAADSLARAIRPDLQADLLPRITAGLAAVRSR